MQYVTSSHDPTPNRWSNPRTFSDASSAPPPLASRSSRCRDNIFSCARRPQALPALQSGWHGGIAQLLQTLMAWLRNVTAPSSQSHFRDATASSTGDPHLAFDGTSANGTTQQARFDSMTDHTDLLDSDSFAGGYRLSTKVTAPNANGVTLNESATITTNGGATVVSMDRNGTATIMQDGAPMNIAAGQTLDLGNGETVTKNADGSLLTIDVDGNGGTIATTMRSQGGYVDVSASAHDVDLGGDVLGQTATPASQPDITTQPVLRRMPEEAM